MELHATKKNVKLRKEMREHLLLLSVLLNSIFVPRYDNKILQS